MKIMNLYGRTCFLLLFTLFLQAEGFNWFPVLQLFEPLEATGAANEGESTLENINCTTETDCTSKINGSICLQDLCKCPETAPIFVNATARFSTSFCLPSFNLTEKNCTFSQQCNYDNGACLKETCLCAERFLVKIKHARLAKKTALIPIIIGSILAVSILGTLLAYFIMSRKKEES
ncbi:EB domain-containing protein [Caerostris extrusa]|uniref:EB domain-containing protein n=1 Tax=Caerostris extrusa TaxID=172846 RepID=A0AAV4MJA2_CAEEX|nr:EB domain-containing protein [Caerostris extrusa]